MGFAVDMVDAAPQLFPVVFVQQPLPGAFLQVAWPLVAPEHCLKAVPLQPPQAQQPLQHEQQPQQPQQPLDQLQHFAAEDLAMDACLSADGAASAEEQICTVSGSRRTVARRMRRARAAQRMVDVPEPASAQRVGAPAQAEAGEAPADDAALHAQLEAGGSARAAGLAALRGSVRRLARKPLGCRVVQMAFDVADRREAAALLGELRGHVLEVLRSPHGNYVLQRAIEALPVSVSGFIAEELAGHVAWVARHRFGCRVLCRLLEHAAMDGRTQALVHEALAEAAELCTHEFGHYVVGSILEHGLEQDRHAVFTALRRDLLQSAMHRGASHLVQAALVHCSEEDQRTLVEELLGDATGLATLAQSEYGVFVVRDLQRRSEAQPRVEALLRDLGLLTKRPGQFAGWQSRS